MKNKIFCIVSIVLGMLWLVVNVAPKHPWPGQLGQLGQLGQEPQSSRLRLRFVNTNMVPVGFPIDKKARLAVEKGIFDNVDVVLMQEVFYRPRWLGIDPLKAFAKRAPHMSLVRPSHRLPPFTYTSSGLACAATPPWKVKCVAFDAFDKCGLVDGMSEKGVAVFEVSNGHMRLRVATTHLQASYANCFKAKDNQARVKQFKQAASFAKRHGAAVLGGDINTGDTMPLDEMSEWVETMGGSKLLDDEACSGRKILRSVDGWRRDPAAGTRLDHAWVLDQSKCKQATQMRTNEEVTRGWSDHAALDVTLIINQRT